MAQLRTAEEFSAYVTSDLTWRIREISDIRSAARASPEFSQAVLRASIPLMYAHWEGHVSVVSRAYVQYLATRRPRYSSLKPSFRLNAFFVPIRRMFQTRLTYLDQIGFLRDVVNSGTKQLSTVNEEVLSARSNLNSAILRDICGFLSIDIGEFVEDMDFIDKILLDRRNNIAHGQYV